VTATVIERLAHVVPLGLRLRDAVTGELVSDGMRVRVIPLRRGKPCDAYRTPSGVFAARAIPGLRDWETRDVGADGLPVTVAAEPAPVRVEVTDALGRFHDFATEIELPCGLYTPDCASPPAGADVPMFSRPGRPRPAGMAVVRAQLVDEADGTPAAYARLEVTPVGAPTAVGIADARGEVMVWLRYPMPAGSLGSPPAGSPPASSRRPLWQATWDLQLAVSVPDAPLSPPGRPALPDLCSLLDQQPATLMAAESPPVVKTTDILEHGRELVLRSSPTNAVLYVRR
jgi:hypothetical protein